MNRFPLLALACYGPLLLLAAPPQPASHYQLVFSEDFDTLDLGAADDGSVTQAHVWYEGVWFSSHHVDRGHFKISNSALSLIWSRGQQQPDTTISTFARRNPHFHAWRYGYFEARLKWRPEEGAWPAVWLIPVEAAAAETPPESGEIDIFEGQGSEPRTFFGTIHRWNGSQHLASTSSHNRFPLPPNANVSEFHTYGLLWVPGRITWYFDEVPLHSEPTYDVFDRQNYGLVVGMQEGSDWKSGNLAGVTASTMTLIVDWIRVWQLHSN
jgi:beta-glucanase (GH16 family)